MNKDISAIGFKEWALVCEALAEGRQSIILRKGGIHEGAKGFRFEHEDFWLFPTGFHQQAEQLKGLGSEVPAGSSQGEEGGEVAIRCRAHTEWARVLKSWEEVQSLAPYHFWEEEILRERFVYNDEQGIWCALLRVECLPEPWILQDRPGFGGCRSWLKLPEPEGGDLSTLRPVLGDSEHGELRQTLETLLN